MIDMLYVIFVDMYIGIIVLINMLIFYLQFAKVVAENEGDLEGMEAAIILEGQDVDNLSEAAGPSTSTSTKGKKRREKEQKDKDDQEAEEVMLQKKKEADDVISILKATLAEPITEVTAYAQYIKMALVSMPRSKFKKARLAINEALAPFLDASDESSGEDLPTMRCAKRRPTRTSSAPSVPSVPPATVTSGDW